MKKLNIAMGLVLIFIGFMLVLSNFVQAEFKDNFDEKLSPLWEPVIGTWELQDGKYNGKGLGVLPGFSLLPFEVADGMEIEVRAMDTGKGIYNNFLIVFSYVNESEIYFAGSAILRGLWCIICTNHGGLAAMTRWQELATFADFVQSNTWYSMKIEISKATVRLSVDGKPKVEHTFDPELPKGKIGLGVSGGDSLFDDFQVRGVDAFSVSPKRSLATSWAKLKS